MMNADFHGLNADFLTVHNQFSTIKSTLDIQFALAQLDTNGNSTNGIINHPVTSGYGNWNGYDSLIALDAWDNYKYMNIYIMNDLYNDGVTNNSGIAWYPNANMSNQRTARIVYNGAYLGTNCNSWNPEFASTLTHEYGHFLNLIHTFEGGCTSPNDNVSDTPPCTTAQGCPSSQTSNAPLNCNNDLVNSENYMDYNTTCYKMFTTGQVGRMVTALNHPARITLWQYSNLVATGLAHLVTGKSIENEKILLDVFPNPANEVLFFQLRGFQENCTLEILNSNGIVVYQDSVIAGKYSSEINCSKFTKGLYFISVKGDNFQEFKKIVLQ